MQKGIFFGEKIPCFICGKIIYLPQCLLRTYKKHFCSNKCRLKTHHGENHPAWKKGITHRNGYRHIYQPEHPLANNRGYVKEHRLVMEEHLGRYLKRSEHVHHINGNILDNRLENLIVLTKQEHAHFHTPKRPRGNKGRLL
jgi:hypothetical protein